MDKALVTIYYTKPLGQCPLKLMQQLLLPGNLNGRKDSKQTGVIKR